MAPTTSQSPFPEAPAPWHCKGECFTFFTYIHAKRGAYPPPAAFEDLERDSAFADPTASGNWKGGLASVFIIRYKDTPIGPYDELMWMHGKFTVPAGGPVASRITRIYVSTTASVYNGRRNWSVAKTYAHFEFTPTPNAKSNDLPYSKVSVSDPSTPDQPFFVVDLTPSFLSAVALPLNSTYIALSMYMAHPPLHEARNGRKTGALVPTAGWVSHQL